MFYKYIYVTAGMDISAGSVPPGPNLTRDEHKHLDQIYEKQMCSYSLKEHLISSQLF